MGVGAKILGAVREEVSIKEYFGSGFCMVVDDMTNMRRTIKNMLKAIEVNNIVEAEDGDVALRKLKELKEDGRNCSFILLDWSMPVMPGIQVIREIRAGTEYVGKDFRDLPVLMITAETNEEQIVQAGEIGVSGYLIKPFVALTLEEKMKTVIHARANPPDNVKLIKAGERMLEAGNYEKAIEYLKAARKLKDSARVMVQLGEVCRKMGEFDRAEKYFLDAAKMNPGYLKAHISAAELYQEMGEEDKALKELEVANRISPNNAERQVVAGKIHLKKGNKEQAEKSFKHASKTDPEMNNEIAEELLKTGDASTAESYFRKSLGKSDGDDVHIYNRLGIALRRQGRWQDAIDEYNKALVVEPRDEVIHFNMGKAFVEGGIKDRAETCFRNALKINSDFKEAAAELKKLGV